MTVLTRTNAHELRTSRGPECHLALDDIVYELVHAAPAPTPEEAAIQDEDQDHNEDYTMNQTSVETPSLSTIARDLDETIEAPRYECGEVIFDLIEDLPGVAQRALVRAIGNNAVARAIYAADWLLTCQESNSPNITADMLDEAEQRVGRWSDLAAWARDEADTIGDSKYDKPMSAEDMFDYLASAEPNVVERNAKLFEARMDLLELDEEEKQMTRELRARRLRDRALKQQQQLASRREDVLHYVMNGDSGQFVPERFTPREHLNLFEKAYDKLRAAAKRALVSDYPNAEDDMIDLTAAAKRIDKAAMAFRRRNRDMLADVVTETAH